ncbi:MAG TPA: glutamate formimidoyltransferase [Vicinamibacterales bacterium]
MPLIEAIPNVSEGRSQEVVDRLTAAITATPGVALLDRTKDPSHHRSVFTLAGEPEAIEQAAIALAHATVGTVDLRSHAGVHPRVGALDVLPFVPLGGTPMQTCVELARRVGRRIAHELSIPVYLYERAALTPRTLEEIRRGGLDGLESRIGQPGWHPDYGPARLHPTAGAVCVAARGPLIAWNLNLDTEDVTIARQIARAIRASSGGLPAVKALGLPLTHRRMAQVSMNLTDYRVTPMAVVYEAVRSKAAARGVGIAESEIIGLVPKAAYEELARAVPWLGVAHAHQVLEDRMREHGLPDASP